MKKAEKINKKIVIQKENTYFAKQSNFYEKFYKLLNHYNAVIKLQKERK